MTVSLKKPNDDLDKFLLRMPDGLRDKLKSVAEENNRSMNAEIVSRLEFSLVAHPHAYLIRALLDLHEQLLAGKDEIELPHDLQNEVRERAAARGVSSQRFLVSLVLEALNQLDEKTPLGEEIDQRIRELRDAGLYK